MHTVHRSFPVHAPARRFGARALTATLALVALTACGDDNGLEPTPTPEPAPTAIAAANFQRLLVADGSLPSARLIGLHNDSVVQSFSLTEPASYVYGTASGRFGAIQQRTAARVNFYDGGVWTEGPLAYRRPAARLNFELTDSLPTHATVTGPWISVFMDGNGRAVWMNENDFLTGSPRVAFDIRTGGPHHSASSTIVLSGTPYFVVAPLNPAGGLPNSVEVRNSAGVVVATAANCPSMHGNAAILNGAAFGCADGLVIVRQGITGVTATKITTSGDMAGLGLRNAWASKSGAGVILGQFAALPGQPTRRVMATIDPVSGDIGALPSLPGGAVDHWRAVEPTKGQIVMFATDGALYVFNAATRQLQHTVASVSPALPATGALTHQVDVAADLAAVASPSRGEVVIVNTATGTVTKRINLGGAPSRLAILGAKSAGRYTLAQ
jgi:hypothetical protein